MGRYAHLKSLSVLLPVADEPREQQRGRSAFVMFFGKTIPIECGIGCALWPCAIQDGRVRARAPNSGELAALLKDAPEAALCVGRASEGISAILTRRNRSGNSVKEFNLTSEPGAGVHAFSLEQRPFVQ